MNGNVSFGDFDTVYEISPLQQPGMFAGLPRRQALRVASKSSQLSPEQRVGMLAAGAGARSRGVGAGESRGQADQNGNAQIWGARAARANLGEERQAPKDLRMTSRQGAVDQRTGENSRSRRETQQQRAIDDNNSDADADADADEDDDDDDDDDGGGDHNDCDESDESDEAADGDTTFTLNDTFDMDTASPRTLAEREATLVRIKQEQAALRHVLGDSFDRASLTASSLQASVAADSFARDSVVSLNSTRAEASTASLSASGFGMPSDQPRVDLPPLPQPRVLASPRSLAASWGEGGLARSPRPHGKEAGQQRGKEAGKGEASPGPNTSTPVRSSSRSRTAAAAAAARGAVKHGNPPANSDLDMSWD